MRYSTRHIAEIDTYDRNSVTSTGYRFRLYSDGTVGAKFRTNWRGGKSGMKFRTKRAVIDPNTGYPEQALEEWIFETGVDGTKRVNVDPLDDITFAGGSVWRQTDPGIRIR